MLITLLLFGLIKNLYGQYNFCLIPPGCRLDECCYPVIMNFEQKCFKIPACAKPFMGDCCYNSRVVKLDHGYIYGYAQLLDDPYGYRDNGKRYLQMFLGIRYAKAPIYELRFKKPERLDRSQDKIEAMEFGASCPQNKNYLKDLINPNINEDCLNLNIFVLNDTSTDQSRNRKYPIMVFFHGGEHKYGSANLYPGHILAQQGIMVVTVNYRLGPFGFLSTEDDNARGNYGLWDQLAALRFIQEYGDRFQGDINKVTLVGHGTGAADVALHMMRLGSGAEKPLQPIKENLFHRVMWLSGSDMMQGGFVQRVGEAKRFAEELGVQVGCSTKDTKVLVECLSKASVDDLANAGDIVKVHGDHWHSMAWSPSIDGEFMSDFPRNLRKKELFLRMRVIGGLTENAGSYIVNQKYPELLSKSMFNRSKQFDLLLNQTREDDALDQEGAARDLLFDYTYEPDSSNGTWMKREMNWLWTDRAIGAGLDYSLKSHSDASPLRNWTQMYVLKYFSPLDPVGHLLGGAYHSTDVSMVFGLPHMNTTSLWTYLGLRPSQDRGIPMPTKIRELDINMTNYMMYFTLNYVTAGNATPDIIRNLTWDTYRPNNRTYFLLDLNNDTQILTELDRLENRTLEYEDRGNRLYSDFELYQDYRIYYYAYWQHYYSILLKRQPRFTTPFPTPLYLEHLKTSSFALAGILALFILILLILLIVLIRKNRELT